MKSLQPAVSVAIRRAVALLTVASLRLENGRGGEIRTHDLYVPNVALYQAKLRPDIFSPAAAADGALREPEHTGRRKQKIRNRSARRLARLVEKKNPGIAGALGGARVMP